MPVSHRSVIGVAAAAMFTVAGTGTSFAASAVRHSPRIPVVESGSVGEASQGVPAEAFRVFHRPTSKYTANSCVIDLSKYDELSFHSKLRGCGTTVRFSTEFLRMSVPNSWGPWSCPPQSESCTPDVMYSNHADAATIDFGTTVTTGGFEYEPAFFQVERVRVAFFSGPHGSGTLVGSITRNVDGHGGARLFAARSETGFRSAVVTNNSNDDFAVAQIRVSP